NCSEKAKRWPAVIPEMEMGCEKGIAGDCERLSWWYSYKADPLDVRRSNAMSARAVELYSKRCPSVPHACYLAVRAGEKAEVKMLPDMRDALYRRGCDAGDGESCWSLGRDKETMRADRACDLGVSNGCFFAGAPLHYGEPVGDLYEAMERLERGCELGHDTACAYLSATVEKLKGDTK
ncbi:MAG: hypothetical protein K1X64_21645, partial [Myxococcaceae bacterium]|nr:hypothetical protein [Myxococcaceae bacterium]